MKVKNIKAWFLLTLYVIQIHTTAEARKEIAVGISLGPSSPPATPDSFDPLPPAYKGPAVWICKSESESTLKENTDEGSVVESLIHGKNSAAYLIDKSTSPRLGRTLTVALISISEGIQKVN